MSDVSTAQSGNFRCSAVAIVSAPKAAIVTLTARPNCALRDRSRSDRRFKTSIMRADSEFWPTRSSAGLPYPWAWLLPGARCPLETGNQPAYPCVYHRGTAMADETATLAAYVANLKFEDIPQPVLERAK